MNTPFTKGKMAFTMFLLFSITVLFSTVAALAATNVDVNSQLQVNYAPLYLVNGESFQSNIADECTTIIFDLSENHPTVVESSSMAKTTVDTSNLGIESGGITMFYDSTTTTAYVLSDYEIFANPSCYNMFSGKSSLT